MTSKNGSKKDNDPRAYVVLERTTLRDLVALAAPNVALDAIPADEVYVIAQRREGRNHVATVREIFDERFGEDEPGELVMVPIAAKMWNPVTVTADLRRRVTVR